MKRKQNETPFLVDKPLDAFASLDLITVRYALSGVLRFGDTDQITAIRFLHAVEAVIELAAVLGENVGACETCDGYGTHECDCGHQHDCRACWGEGIGDYASRDFAAFPKSVIRAAGKLIKEREREEKERKRKTA